MFIVGFLFIFVIYYGKGLFLLRDCRKTVPLKNLRDKDFIFVNIWLWVVKMKSFY